MEHRSPQGFCARTVSSLSGTRFTGQQIGNLLARWAAQAQAMGTYSYRRARKLLAASAAAAVDRLSPTAAMEPLEGRRLLSAVGLAGGVLNLTGDMGAANNLSVDMMGNGKLFANADGQRLEVPARSVSRINISGGMQQDLIYVNPAIKSPVNISTAGGNDVIKSGSGNDTISTGNGNSVIYGSGVIQAGNGNNEIHVGDLNSTVSTGSGNNLLVAGKGNDTISAGGGYDTMVAGSGYDVLNGGAHTTFQNLTSRDKVNGGAPTQSPSSRPSPTPQPPVSSSQGSSAASGPEDATIYGSNHGDSLAPTPIIQVMGVSGPAAHSVFVDALSSNLGAGQPITAKYQWNFGDPGSRFNVLPGWNAGHIYDNPGTYTITLTITNEAGRTSSLSTRIVVTPNTRRVIYVDANGSDYNSGLSPAQAVRSVDRVKQLLGSNTTVLFHGGQTFTVSNGIDMPYQNVEFSSYGGSNAVLMKVAGDGNGIFSVDSSADQLVVENLTFDSIYKPNGNIANHISAVGVYPAGRNITVRDNIFLNIDDAVNAYRSPTGLLVQDNSCPLVTGLRGYLEYIDGSEQVIIGNYVANSTREHDLRSTDNPTSRILIAGNTLNKPWRQNVDPGDIQKTTINIRSGSYFYVADNTLSGAMVGLGPGPWTPADWAADDIVLDGNTLNDAQIYAASAVHHLMIRNNLLDIQDTQQIWLKPLDPAYPSRAMSDVMIEDNTGVTNSNKGVFLMLDGPSPAGIVTVKNNLFSAPHFEPGLGFAASVVVHAWDTSAFALFSHNVWAAPTWRWSEFPNAVNFVAPVLDLRQYKTASGWNNQGNVQDDQFRVVSVWGSNLQVAIDGQMAGAILPPLMS